MHPHHKLKKPQIILIILLITVFGGLFLYNVIKTILINKYFAHYQPPAVTVSSVKALKKNWEPHLQAVGNFVAKNGVDINAQVAGNVTAIYFESGQYVESGKPLIDIDDTVEQATLKFNQADLALQKVNYQRQQQLLVHHATSTSSADEVKAKLLQAQANVEKTEALIRQKHLTAPFSGKLGINQINLGEYIQPGKTAIVTLQSLDPILLEFYLPEQLIEQLQINQTILLSIEQNPNYLFKGKITAINSKVDPNTHNIQVEGTLSNCPTEALLDPEHSSLVKVEKVPQTNQLLITCDTALNEKNHMKNFNFIPGMFTAIEIVEPSKNQVIVLPSTAISYSLYGNSVFVIEKTTENKETSKDQPLFKVKRVFVTTGEQQGNNTEIKSGLKPGQLVVASGELKLQDGTQVLINNDVQLPDTPTNELGP